MLYHHKKEQKYSFREKRLTLGWLDFFKAAGEGLGEGFKGIGSAFEGLGNLINALGGGFKYIIKHGPQALYAMYLRGKHFSVQSFHELTKGDPPLEELPEYASDDLRLPNPEETEDKLAPGGRGTIKVYKYFKGGKKENEFDQEKYDDDAAIIWRKRKRVLEAGVRKIEKENRSEESEYAYLERRIDQINKARVARLTLISNYQGKLQGIQQRRELLDPPEGSPADVSMQREEDELLEKLSEIEEDVDVHDQDWYLFDENGQPIKEPDPDDPSKMIYRTERMNLQERKLELEGLLEGSRLRKTFLLEQIDAIDAHWDPDGVWEARKMEMEEARKKADERANIKDGSPDMDWSSPKKSPRGRSTR